MWRLSLFFHLVLSRSGTWTPGVLKRGSSTGTEEDHDGRHGMDGVRADDGPFRIKVLKGVDEKLARDKSQVTV